MSARPEKAGRARGHYARLICLNCRKRKIKCVLPPEAAAATPSGTPQPPEKSCERCRLNGLECVVDATVLGRPASRRRGRSRASSAPAAGDGRRGRSASPYFEELILKDPDGDPSRRAVAMGRRPAKPEMLQAIGRTFYLTSALFARDRRFGSAVNAFQAAVPRDVREVVSGEVVALLDSHLVWFHFYNPWNPSLAELHAELAALDMTSESACATTLLFALLCSLALDVPSERLRPHRHLQPALDCIAHHVGQRVLFRLPRHRHTLFALGILAEYRPVAALASREAAAHVISGRLYDTLSKTLLPLLGLDAAPAALHNDLDSLTDSKETAALARDALVWCAWTLMDIDLHADFDGPVVSDRAVQRRLWRCIEDIARAVALGRAPTSMASMAHMLWAALHELLTLRRVTLQWESIEELAGIIDRHRDWRRGELVTKRSECEALLRRRGLVDEATAFVRLDEAQRFTRSADITGLALFYAYVSGDHAKAKEKVKKAEEGGDVAGQEAVAAEESKEKMRAISRFMQEYGNRRMDVLETQLSTFVTLTDTISLAGCAYVAPPRLTVIEMLFTCKTIVEFNAALTQKTGKLHERLAVQMVLMMEVAKRLEGQRGNKNMLGALQNGSLVVAAAGLIRNLHGILGKWQSQKSKTQFQDGGDAYDGLKMDQAKLNIGTLAIVDEMEVESSVQEASIQDRNGRVGSVQGDNVPETGIQELNSQELDISGSFDLFSNDLLKDWGDWLQLDPSDLPMAFGGEAM